MPEADQASARTDSRGEAVRRIVLWVTGLVSAFALSYAAYVHVVAHARRMSPEARDFRDSFVDADRLPSNYTVSKVGNLAHGVRGGVLAIEGQGKAGDELVFAMPQRRFDDGVITLRFRIATGDAVETFVGFEQPNTGKRLVAAFAAGDKPFVHLGGETSGLMRSGTTNEDVKVDVNAHDWHTLSFNYTPMYGLVSASLDGRPLLSLYSGWFQGSEAKLILGTRLRGDVERAQVEIESVGMETLDWAQMRSFEERFNGEFVDAKRWSFHYPNPDLGRMDARVDKGKGLLIDSTMHGITVDPVFMFLMRTFPFPLTTMQITADVSVEEINHASFFMGFMGASAWTNADKVFDVGVARHKEDQAEMYAAGEWSMNGMIGFDPGGKIELPKRFSIVLRFDAQTGKATASVDGKQLGEHVLDLKPLDIVSVRLGAIGHAADAHVRAHVHHISLEMR